MIELINFKTGEVVNLDPDNLKALMEIYEAAKIKKDEAFRVMDNIKILLIEKTKRQGIDPTRLTRRIEGHGITAIIKENPKISWDEIKLAKAKRILGNDKFSRFFSIVTEFKPTYRELNKLPHTVAETDQEGKAYKLILDAKVSQGSNYSLSWEKSKDGVI